jgi:CubicO group peptidase (beta-lactamase class C family)
MKARLLILTLSLALLLASCAPPATGPAPATAGIDQALFAQFESELEALRQQLKIPGFSAAIVQDQALVWARGFGYADVENQIPATPNTPYRLASVTKPIAATLLMQLVAEGALALSDPVSRHGVELESDGKIQVWHLLTHTSEGVPGARHRYNGDRYSRLGAVMEAATGQSFAQLLTQRVLQPLGMADTAPSYPACTLALLASSPDAGGPGRNEVRVNQALARPYQLGRAYNVLPGAYPSGFSPAAGLISTVVDLAKFDVALDQGLLLSDEAKAQMFEPAVSTYADRTDLMYGLGWYTQRYQGTRLLWHTGRWAPSVSSLYLKVPDQQITFLILANSTYLSTPYPLGQGDVLYSTLAETFYRTFVFPRQTGKAVPRIDWDSQEEALVDQLSQVAGADVRELLERELWSHRQLFASMRRTTSANRLLAVHRQVYGTAGGTDLDLYAFRGVDYIPVPSAQIELDAASLAPFVGDYVLSDIPPGAEGALPAEVRIEAWQGSLYGVNPDQQCISLVPLTPVRFAIPESPGLTLEFHITGDTVETVAVQAGPLAAVYAPKH